MKKTILNFLILSTAIMSQAQEISKQCNKCEPGCQYVCNGGEGDPMVCECACYLPPSNQEGLRSVCIHKIAQKRISAVVRKVYLKTNTCLVTKSQTTSQTTGSYGLLTPSRVNQNCECLQHDWILDSNGEEIPYCKVWPRGC